MSLNNVNLKKVNEGLFLIRMWGNEKPKYPRASELKRHVPIRAQSDYENHVKARPLYHDGAQRKTWGELPEICRWSWARPKNIGLYTRNPLRPWNQSN